MLTTRFILNLREAYSPECLTSTTNTSWAIRSLGIQFDVVGNAGAPLDYRDGDDPALGDGSQGSVVNVSEEDSDGVPR